MEVKKIAYYQNKAIPLKIRMEAFAKERLLLLKVLDMQINGQK